MRKRFEVYNTISGQVVEGGFFSRDAAKTSAENWTRETGQTHVARKES